MFGRYRLGAARLGAAALLTTTALLTAASPAAAADVDPAQRAYTIKVIMVKAIDETGPFNSGLSDEIYAGFRVTPKVGSALNEFQTRILGDFDAGETRVIPSNQNCLSTPFVEANNPPAFYLSGLDGDAWRCSNANGRRGPFSITGALWERDTAIFPCGIPCSFDPSIPGVLDRRGNADDSVGQRSISFSTSGLAADLPTVGQFRDYAHDFTGGGGHYRVTYQLQRVF